MNYFLPCLLERWSAGTDGRSPHRMKSTAEDVRRDVLRNLEWLLNTEAPRTLRDLMFNSADPRVEAGEELPPEVQCSVLCFGVPPYSGRANSNMAPKRIAEAIRQRILYFEPRIDPDHLDVHPLDDEKGHQFNTLKFSVQGLLWPKPLQEFEVRTELDLESGQARLIRRSP